MKLPLKIVHTASSGSLSAPCSALLASPDWPGGSEVGTFLMFTPVWIFFFWVAWRIVSYETNKAKSNERSDEESHSHMRRNAQKKHSDSDQTNRYPENASHFVKEGSTINRTMLDKPSHSHIDGDNGGENDRCVKAVLPKLGSSGVLDNASSGDGADTVAISSESIHKACEISESSFLPNA